ncbi:MAG: type 3-dehydroquinate dehydratase [Geminicoccaceae bacterium]|jgi:3-dehydroquinate dehydratase II|nr:type 3-dehydroquinate dehydratase [Geminicoccaceae bacterium]
MSKHVFVLNGANLNLLGMREPQIYGSATLADVEALCRARADELGLAIDFRQSNSEGTLVDWIHEAIGAASGIVINPAGHSFTSIPILDALKVFRWPIVEVHISNIHRREPYYHRSYVSYAATGVIAGLGVRGYVLALDAISELLRQGEPAR